MFSCLGGRSEMSDPFFLLNNYLCPSEKRNETVAKRSRYAKQTIDYVLPQG